ncbi:methyl-accepting chemotaxis protein [Herbaspirillum rubrisubalbicans]|uniref:Methyl-accepting chemotaxis protein n=1 Tax=Herbaspirillum rubrisubalbicans TaxID=80842 RepID=A0AAD0UE40_9BURK|nr:methyl-accepting chemotaxis protein [Herbaspirillum rubrisubalbicans]AYR25915.1 methyl-accepting chemotaxis protein [Herbaspirillum rubrisubalbicans]
MFANLTIKTRLITVIGFLLVISFLIGTTSLISLINVNNSLKTVYEDRLIALSQLDQVIRSSNKMQINIARALVSSQEELATHIASFKKEESVRDKVWKDYLATYLTPDEKALADTLVREQKLLDEKGFAPALNALNGGDMKTVATLIHGDIARYATSITETMNALIQLQTEVAKSEYENSQQRYQSFRSFSIAAIICSILVGSLIGLWLIRSINRPLNSAIEVAQRIASGDLTQSIEVGGTNEMGRLLRALQEMSKALTQAVTQVRHSTDSITTASAEIASGNLDLSSRTEEQAASLEQTASSMEELTSTVKQNADNALQANVLMAQARKQAENGGGIVNQVVATMNDIKQSSSHMVDIINVIDGIAFQTNILALNAAVEAARAGEQGRGFAVVASEVRGLAQRSASAAKEIRELIEASLQKISSGGNLVNDAGAVMEETVDSVKRVAQLMEDIAAASQEQSNGIDQVNLAIGQMDQVTQQNAALVEEAAAAASSLRDQAQILTGAVSVFKTEQSHHAMTLEM